MLFKTILAIQTILLFINLTLCSAKSISAGQMEERSKREISEGSRRSARSLFGQFIANLRNPYVPTQELAITKIEGSGTAEDPCGAETAIVGGSRSDTLGTQLASSFQAQSDKIMGLSGQLGDEIAGKKGAVSKKQALTDKIFIDAQNLISTAGGSVLDAAGKFTGLGKQLHKMGAGHFLGTASGIFGGGMASIAKGPQDAIKAIASLTGINSAITGRKPVTNKPQQVILEPNNPCGPAKTIVALGPAKITAG